MPREGPQGVVAEFRAHFAFLSRLPVRADRFPDFSRAWWAFPLCGLLLGVGGGLVALAASSLGLGPLAAATFGILALVLVTGALHEDGLADCCDAIGAAGRERRLEILRDSRIGTFGALAAVFSVLLRCVTFSEILSASPLLAPVVLGSACTLSRALALAPLALLPPARKEGLGAAAMTRPPTLVAAVLVSACLSAIAWPFTAVHGIVVGLVAAGVAAVLAALWVTYTAYRLLGGQTGDVAGAAVQVAEIVFLSGLATFVAA